MQRRYELRDSHYPTWRGMRFSDLARAEKALKQSVPSGRFYIFDRLTKERI